MRNRNAFKLLSASDVPVWINDNEFLCHHHRPITPSIISCLKSIFRIHSETGNIWTHMIGFVIVLVSAFSFFTKLSSNDIFNSRKVQQTFTDYFLLFWLPSRWEWPKSAMIGLSNTKEMIQKLHFIDHAMFTAFFIGALTCLLMSTTYHLFFCYSFRAQQSLACFDYFGIILLIVTSGYPITYYNFYCQPSIICLHFVALTFFGVVFSFQLLFCEMDRNVRTLKFLLVGIVSGSTGVLYILTNNWEKSHNYMRVDLWFLVALLYIAGVLLYSFRIPERYKPSLFNIWLQGHQIFHVLVVAAIFVEMKILYIYACYRLSGKLTC